MAFGLSLIASLVCALVRKRCCVVNKGPSSTSVDAEGDAVSTKEEEEDAVATHEPAAPRKIGKKGRSKAKAKVNVEEEHELVAGDHVDNVSGPQRRMGIRRKRRYERLAPTPDPEQDGDAFGIVTL